MLDQTSAQTPAARLADRAAPPAASLGAAPAADRAAEAAPPGTEHLLFVCRAVPCAVALGALREVLRAVPPCVALPFSPPWLLGVFAHRTELLGLVDPAPLLLGAARGAVRDPSAPPPAATLIVGHDDQMLGLAVEALGEIVLIRPDEIAATSGEPMDETSVAPPYLRGYYQPPAADDAVAYAVVDLEPFVATLLDALREGVAHG